MTPPSAVLFDIAAAVRTVAVVEYDAHIEFAVAEYMPRRPGSPRMFRKRPTDLPTLAKKLTDGMRSGETVEWLREDGSVWVLTAQPRQSPPAQGR